MGQKTFHFNGHRSKCMSLNSKGAALVIVIATILVVTVLIISGMNFAASNSNIGSRVLDGIQAFYFAEAGIQRAVYKIKTEADPLNIPQAATDWPFAGQNVSLSINTTVTPGTYQVLSTCTFGQSQSSQNITATIQKQGATITLLAWGS